MLPITLEVTDLPVAIIGAGPLAERRAEQLRAAGASRIRRYEVPPPSLEGIRLILAADLPPLEAENLAARARAAGILINVEDVVPLCDFHMPATVRRGALTVAVSTTGRSPALARLFKAWLERWLAPGWTDWIEELGRLRLAWRADGQPPAEIFRRTEALIEEQGWRPKL